MDVNHLSVGIVTPYVGVWIETVSLYIKETSYAVTPYVGVWIETLPRLRTVSDLQSLLMWECGLKQKTADGERLDGVTPYVGVWIETCLMAAQ